MSLSKLCVEQHEREQVNLRKLLLFGLLGSVSLHAIGFSLSFLDIWQRTSQPELSPIELIVTEPPLAPMAEPPEVAPAELSRATNDPASAAMAQANPATVVAADAPAQPAELVKPEPEPEAIPETAVEAELTESEKTEQPEATEADAPEVEDSEEVQENANAPAAEAPPEELATPTEFTDSQLERLRRLLQRSAGAASTGTTIEKSATARSDSASVNTGNAAEPAAPTGTGPGNQTNPAGSSTGQGSRTVACQNCALPQYPDSALADRVEGMPRVQVDINPDGTMRSVTLVQSSGNAAIDQAAIQAARSSSFQPVAGGASVPIEYDLTIEGSRRNREAQRRGNRRSVEVPAEVTETTPQTAKDHQAEEPPAHAAAEEKPNSPAANNAATEPENAAADAPAVEAMEAPEAAPRELEPAPTTPLPAIESGDNPPPPAPEPEPNPLPEAAPLVPEPVPPAPATPKPAAESGPAASE